MGDWHGDAFRKATTIAVNAEDAKSTAMVWRSCTARGAGAASLSGVNRNLVPSHVAAIRRCVLNRADEFVAKCDGVNSDGAVPFDRG